MLTAIQIRRKTVIVKENDDVVVVEEEKKDEWKKGIFEKQTARKTKIF